jgi:hypothetical protein
VHPDPDPLLLRKSGSAGNRTRTSGSVARKSDYYTTEVVTTLLPTVIKKIIQFSTLKWLLASLGGILLEKYGKFTVVS